MPSRPADVSEPEAGLCRMVVTHGRSKSPQESGKVKEDREKKNKDISFDPHALLLTCKSRRQMALTACFLSEYAYKVSSPKTTPSDAFGRLLQLGCEWYPLFQREGSVEIYSIESPEGPTEARHPMVLARDPENVYVAFRGTKGN
eukprot:gene9997-8871_t